MRLQERIFEALGLNGLTPKAIYQHFATDPAAAVDFAIRGLVKEGRIALVNGVYQRPRSAAPEVEHVVMEGDTVVTATNLTIVDGGEVKEGVALITVTASEAVAIAASESRQPAGYRGPVPDGAVPIRKCRRCQAPKPLTDFPLKGTTGAARMMTCRTCWDYEAERALKAKAAKAHPSLPGVTELVRRTESDRTPQLAPDLVVRLIERQSAAAKALQVACDEVQRRRQELADIEAVVRMVTGRGI